LKLLDKEARVRKITQKRAKMERKKYADVIVPRWKTSSRDAKTLI
jgi:hypothetical protein